MSRNSGDVNDQESNRNMQFHAAVRPQYSVTTAASSSSNSSNINNNNVMVSDRGQIVEAQMLHSGTATATGTVTAAMAVQVARSVQQQQSVGGGGIRTGTPSNSPSPSQSPASSMQVSTRVTSSSTSTAAASSSSTTRTATPCAACKLLRRKCVPECPFSPYFHPSEPHKFACVHKIFGASNVSKMLLEVPEVQRVDVANSLVFEANARIRDPVYGCLGAISALQQEAQALQAELHAIRTQIMNFKFQERAMVAAASATHHSEQHHHQQQQYNQHFQANNNLNSNQLAHAPFKPSHFASPSFNSHIVHSNNSNSNNNNDHFNIHSPSSHSPMQTTSINMDLKEQHYWSQLHQSC